jgi:hypothetical protein
MDAAPPAYEAGKIYGTPDDVERARAILAKYNPSARIIGAWAVEESLIKQIRNTQFCFMACLIPLSMGAASCQLCTILNQLEILRNTTYILTEEGFITAVMDCNPPCACSTTGQDIKEVQYEHMGDITVNNQGSGLCSCMNIPRVEVRSGLPPAMAGAAAASGAMMMGLGNTLVTRDPNHMAQLIRMARKTHLRSERNLATVVVQQPVAAPAAAPKRVMVALGSAPNAVKILNIAEGTPWESFLEEASKKLDSAGKVSRAELQLPGGGSVAVSSTDDVQNNDKLLIFIE